MLPENIQGCFGVVGPHELLQLALGVTQRLGVRVQLFGDRGLFFRQLLVRDEGTSALQEVVERVAAPLGSKQALQPRIVLSAPPPCGGFALSAAGWTRACSPSDP